MLVDFFPPENIYCSAIFDFRFRENPCFSGEFQALNTRAICKGTLVIPYMQWCRQHQPSSLRVITEAFSFLVALYLLFLGCLTSRQQAHCISKARLLTQFYVLPYWDISCWSILLSKPVTAHWPWVNHHTCCLSQSQCTDLGSTITLAV